MVPVSRPFEDPKRVDTDAADRLLDWKVRLPAMPQAKRRLVSLGIASR